MKTRHLGSQGLIAPELELGCMGISMSTDNCYGIEVQST
jgi:aryl-alcohol dehydrogenase-like predicted oxidoreductase